MTRRYFLATVAAIPAAAPAADPDPRELFGALASALSERDARDFIRHFDPDMKGLDQLRANVEALVSQADVVCSIDFVGQSQEGSELSLQVDWAMTLQSREAAAGGPTERRRQVLAVRLRRRGQSYQIIALAPLEFFNPPQFS